MKKNIHAEPYELNYKHISFFCACVHKLSFAILRPFGFLVQCSACVD